MDAIFLVLLKPGLSASIFIMAIIISIKLFSAYYRTVVEGGRPLSTFTFTFVHLHERQPLKPFS